ncbi:MAG: M3 family oligoendopeptidase [Pirellulales bacterium]
MSQPAVADLPCWNLSNIYSSVEAADYATAFSQLAGNINAAEKRFDELGVRRLDACPESADQPLANRVAEIVDRLNGLARLYETMDAFVHGLVTTNSYDAAAAREQSKLELLEVRRQQLDVRFKGWIGSLGPLLEGLIPLHHSLAEHAFYLRDTARQSQFLMSAELEALAAELCISGGGAFGKLQGTVTSQLKVAFARDGQNVEELPITVVRNLCFDADPALRERAYRAEVAGWHGIRATVAACINGVKGTAVTLARRRGRASVLDVALDDNRIDRPTLDALLGSIREYFPMFRRYLRSKASKLGKQQLAWWDIFAPVGAHMTMSWPQAEAFIVERFGQFSQRLGDYARRSFDEAWIDAGPRDGKRGGAFCMPIVGRDESRVLMNYDGSFDQVSTLAHELGHGFHNDCQSGLPPLRRGAPSTLAETASIFCETLSAEGALASAAPAEQLAILETQLAGATQVCLDISSRFLFESALLERRAQSEASPDDLCQMLLAAQKETYGDAIDESTYHPYMWVWKPHYYSYAHNFYNFPYAFGHLFGLGLYAAYQQEGASFIPRYEALLRATGEDYAAPLAQRFGIDITRPDFWRQSLSVVEGQLQRYEAL